MAHITLIRPPIVLPMTAVTDKQGCPSIGLAYLISAIRAAGHEVTAIDAFGEAIDNFTKIESTALLVNGLNARDITSRIPADTDVIGLSCMFSNEWIYSRIILEHLHEKFPTTPIIGGGEHFTADPEYSFTRAPYLHAMVLGEGEETAVELLDAIERNKPLEEIHGLGLVRNGEFMRTPARARVVKLDQIPWPSWQDFPLETYLDAGFGMSTLRGRSMPMIASRGCPFKCTFCSNPLMWTNRWVSRDPNMLIEEIITWRDLYNINNIEFYDLTTIVNRKWTIEFCQLLIERDINLTWSLPSGTRSEALDREVVQLLKKSGCNMLTYAPESGSIKTLKRIKKQVKLDKMLESMKNSVECGIILKANMILGFPGQSHYEVLESFIFMVKLAWIGVHDVPVMAFVPYPGSELYFQLVEQGKISKDDPQKYEMFLAGNVYSEIFGVNSYSEYFSSRTLNLLTLGGMAWFYSWQFLFRPSRLVGTIKRFLKGEPVTMLDRVLEGIRMNFLTKKRKANVLDTEFVDDVSNADRKTRQLPNPIVEDNYPTETSAPQNK